MRELIVNPNPVDDPNRLSEDVGLFNPEGSVFGNARPIYRTEFDLWPHPTWNETDHDFLVGSAGSSIVTLLPSDTIHPEGVPAARRGIHNTGVDFFSGEFAFAPSSVESGWNGWGWTFDTPPGLIGFNFRVTLVTKDALDITEAQRERVHAYVDIYEDPVYSGREDFNGYSSYAIPSANFSPNDNKYIWIEGSGFLNWPYQGFGMQPSISLPAGTTLDKDMYISRVNFEVFHMGGANTKYNPIPVS